MNFANYPVLSWQHGAASEAMTLVGGVYRRTFANGLALVNPSTTTSANYTLTGTWHDFNGVNYSGTITLAVKSARVLLPGAM